MSRAWWSCLLLTGCVQTCGTPPSGVRLAEAPPPAEAPADPSRVPTDSEAPVAGAAPSPVVRRYDDTDAGVTITVYRGTSASEAPSRGTSATEDEVPAAP